MAEGDGAIYNNFKEQVMEGIFNLASGGDTIKVTLHTGYTPDIDAHTVWADTGVSSTEYGTGSGYTAGGATLAGQDVTQDDANDRGVFDGTDVTWSSLGPLSPATPSHAIMWDDTPAAPADPLIAYWELGTTATNGGDYTLQWGANGIILLT
jgi:hypothetical protein